jgi:type I restriction enzyme S subunit
MNISINTERLPEGWAVANTCDVCEILAGGPAPQGDEYFLDGDLPFVRVQDMGRLGDEVFLRRTADLINERAARKLRLFPEGSILFTKSGASTLNNQRAILGQESYVVSHIGVLIPSPSVSNKWVYFWFKGVDFKKLAHSTVMPSLPLSKINNLDIPIPPINEQHLIIAKIEALFSELDKGIESFKTAREQLKIYRQALLKHAFSGKLTEQWRAENQSKLESAEALLQRLQTKRQQRFQQQLKDWEANGKPGSKPKAPKTLPPLTVEELAELPELPEGWVWLRLIESCEEVVDCHNKTAPYQDSGIELVRTPSIRDMKLNFDDSIRYVSQETYEFWSRRCIPLPGDVLFTREAPMGEAAIIPEGKKVCMGQRIMLLRSDKTNLSAKYLLCATQTPIFKKLSDTLAVGTGVKHLRVGDVERLLIPICAYSEQLEIETRLDECLSEVDQLDQTISTALQQAEALRQSILKKAFSGQLVPQDPTDEPASVLLERIRAEKAQADIQPARRRGKTT